MLPVTGGPEDPEARARDRFDRARADADEMLAQDGEPESFAVWVLAVIRRQSDRYLRYAVLDGVMAAMDDDEARRAR